MAPKIAAARDATNDKAHYLGHVLGPSWQIPLGEKILPALECAWPALNLLLLGWEGVGAQTDLAEQQGGEHKHKTRMHLMVPSLFPLFFTLPEDLGQYFYLCFPLYLFICLFICSLYFFFFLTARKGK